MEHESRRVGPEVRKHFDHPPPCLAAVNGGGKLPLARDGKLFEEHGLLVCVAAVLQRVVEPDFADHSAVPLHAVLQGLFPSGSPVSQVPRMEAERGDDPVHALRELRHVSPIRFR